MDTIIDMLFLPHLFKYGFVEKAKCTEDGTIGFALQRSYGEGTYLMKPVGKSLAVSVTDFRYRQPVELVWEQPKYFHISLWCGSGRQGMLGHIGTNDVYRQNCPAGFCHSGIGVSFLPDFFDTFLGLRHGISRDELTQALAALNRFAPPPDAVVVLKQIGDVPRYGHAGNAWFEAKILELVSLVLDWHKGLATTARPPIKEHDREGIAESLRYAGDHFAGPLTLEAMAKQAAMSMSKFTLTFKMHTGLSAACYIRRIRMEKAMYLIKNTSDPLGEIATSVGYKRHASFSAAFREEFGIAPVTFRKKS
jgi:AraC-like DNA-binding protein